MIEYRVLTPDDWPLWRALRLAALADAPTAFGSTLADWTGAGDTEWRWRARLSDVPFNVVLTWHGEPVGMVSAIDSSADGSVELISLWVVPAVRGQGVGDAAVCRVLEWARIRRAESSVVLAVRLDNVAAARLYRRHGFVDAGLSPEDPSERLMRRD